MANSLYNESGSDSGSSDLSSSSSLHKDIRTLAEQLHHAWSSSTPVSSLAAIRDQILASRSRVDVRILTLSSVARIACPGQALADDSRWTDLFALASACTSDSDAGDELDYSPASRRKRKRTDNVAYRLRNLALLASLWSPSVVEYYGWSSAGNAQINIMRLCALRWPRFMEDFCPRLNSVLLQRHREALRDSRVRSLNEAALQPLRDFKIDALETAVVDQAQVDMWTHSNDGDIPVDDHGSLLSQLRPNHFHSYLLQQDRYGMLISRNTHSNCHLPDLQASVSPFPLSPFAADSTGSVLPGGDAASILNVADVSLTPPFSPFTFSSTQDTSSSTHDTSNGSSTVGGASISEGGQWDTPPACIIEEEVLRATHENLRQHIYRQSTPQLTLNPAVLSLNQTTVFRDQFFQPLSPELPILSERFLGEQLGLQARSHDVQDLPSRQRQAIVVTPPLLPSPVTPRNERMELTVSSPLVQRSGPLAVEEVLHNKYRSTIMCYAERLYKEADYASASVQRKLRAQWLTDKTAWASFTRSNAKTSSIGGHSYEEADVICLTAGEFVAMASQNEIFEKPILIKESFSDSGMHTVKGLASQLIDAIPNGTFDVMSLDVEHPEQTPIQEFFKSACPDQLVTAVGMQVLNLRNVTKAHRPLFTMLPRFRLLESLVNRAQGRDMSNNAGPFPADMYASLNFNMLELAGSFSGPQLTASSGTWFRNLDGVKLCMIVPEFAMDSGQWKAIGELDRSWVPHRDAKLLILEQDDVLLIPPGSKVVRAFHSLTDGVMEGGMYWDDLNVIATLRAVLWERSSCMSTTALCQSSKAWDANAERVAA
ncbi:hypothetical protein E8E14_001103 [Neopestalotiopsis sp. 37M]|nr:hypothetical protein E8E14_001103 [Neopestalotiopsis sp. 37M]